MKILAVASQWFPDYAGGTARVVRATAEALADKGHEIGVIVPAMREQQPHTHEDGFDVHRILRRTPLPMTLTDPWKMRRSMRALKAGEYDHILCHGEASVAATFHMPTRPKITYVFHASPFREARHRRSLGVGPLASLRSLGVEPFLYAWEQYALRAADRILVLSEFSRQLVLDYLPGAASRIAIVGGGVDTSVFQPAINRRALRTKLGVADDQQVIMTARRLVNRMGVDVLIDAFRSLYRNNRNLKLVIAGDGEMRTALQRHAGELVDNGAVGFCGRISDNELLDWYRAADLFVLPTVAYEGFGMVTAEALACGTPVVGTPVGATGELLSSLNPDLIAASPTSAELAATIRQALASVDDSFRTECRDYALRHFDWRAVIRKWESAMGADAKQPDRLAVFSASSQP